MSYHIIKYIKNLKLIILNFFWVDGTKYGDKWTGPFDSDKAESSVNPLAYYFL